MENLLLKQAKKAKSTKFTIEGGDVTSRKKGSISNFL